MTAGRFLSVEDVADELAVSKAQVYSIVKSGELPAIQIGPKNVWRIERARLEEYIEERYAATRDAVARDQLPADESRPSES